MAGQKHSPVPNDNHVVRRCGYQVIERDIITNRVIGLFPAAMQLRKAKNETYLSMNFLEHCPGTRNERLKSVVAIQRSKASTALSLDSGVAVLNAGKIREIGSAHKRNLAVRHTPNRNDASYSRVSGLPLDNSDEHLIAALIEEAYRDFTLLRDVDALP